MAGINTKRFIPLCGALILLMLLCASTLSEEPERADVRLVIDISGSMKRNDPNNLRQPAVELLVQLLPEGSKAGVWTFDKWVNMLVPHREVDEQWRESALQQAKQINSVGLYTNIGKALEKATDQSLNNDKAFRTSVILLTDGMVDIDKRPEVNQKEWRRIVDQVLPEIKASDYTLHTIALSDNADTNLMTKLSLATDGVAEVAHTADDLMRIFLKAFDVAAPAEQVPLTDNQFVIDSSVEEFTALIFRKNPSEQTQLVGPDGGQFSAAKPGAEIKWHRAENYDLITVKRPLEGEWGVKADMAPDSRVTVVSNLNLRVSPLPNNIIKGHRDKLVLSLREDGQTIEREEFLRLMDISASMEAGTDEFSLQEYWREAIRDPVNGVYTKDLPVFDKDGIYQLNIIVDGKSFIRQFNHQFTVRPPFDAKVEPVFKDGKFEYQIVASGYNTNFNPAETQVVASISAPGGRKKIIPLKATGQDTWQATLLPDKEGEYLATIKAKGKTMAGESFAMELAPISFVYSSESGFVEAEQPFFDEEKSEAKQEPAKQAETTAANPSKDDEKPQPEVEEEAPPKESNWILYAALAGGNILLFALGYFAYRKIMGGQSADQVLNQFSDENIEQQSEEAPQEEDPEPEEEEEPPMEDLDVSEESASEPEPESDDEDLDPVDVEPELDSLMEAAELATDEPDTTAETDADTDSELDVAAETGGELEVEVEEAMAQEPESKPDVGDDFDDLEEMAMEQPDASDEPPKTEENLSVVPEEDDMVSEMLKAQGLDLAEEELDDAISSLIDDLSDDEEKT